MGGHTWKNIVEEKEKKIKNYLINYGGEEKNVKNPSEIWRVKYSDVTFTYYNNGTLYCTSSKSKDSSVEEAWRYIDEIVGSRHVLPSKEFLIGLDETGKGELIGHTVLTGVLFPSNIFNEVDKIIGSADTKKSHNFEFWDEIFKKLNRFGELVLIEEKIPPWQVDRYNLNKIMDVTYQRILNQFFNKIEINRCRIVLDDYGIGDTLNRFFNFLKKQNAEVIITKNAEDKYLEVKVASLLSKRTREAIILSINNNDEFTINGKKVGSGNAGDQRTIEWLKEWKAAGKEWPWFIKRSYKTIRELDGITEEPKKQIPPINETLLSKDFINDFNEGRFNITALSVVCPNCGTVAKSVKLIPWKNRETQPRCINCDREIKDLSFTLRYYCGRVIPDTNSMGFVYADLKGKKFFENFIFILSSVIKYECDQHNVPKEAIKNLGEFASKGRIKLEETSSAVEVDYKNLNTTQRDEIILKDAINNNAILLTKDNRLKTFAQAKRLFVLEI